MNEFSSNVWMWREPDRRWLHKVLDHINTSTKSDNDIIILHCEDVTNFETSIPLTNYIFNLSFTFNLLEDERTMFLKLKEMISSMELYMGRQKENVTSGNDISDEEISKFYYRYISCFELENEDCDKSITGFKKFLKQNNCIDVHLLLDKCQKDKNSNFNDHINSYRYLILGTPCSLVLKQLIGILNKKIYSLCVETPLDISLHGNPNNEEEIKVVVESMKLEKLSVKPFEYSSKTDSATEEYVEDIILSFLSLLVTSRNELSLSKAMISPLINLSHEAFTALKHLSIEKEMPMCQVAISYVTRMRLGGKSYAPARDCPMLPYLKGLEIFVDTLNQMQMLIEEEFCPSTAIKKLINILKKKLLRCGSDKLKESSVLVVSENLLSLFSTVFEVLKSRISCATSQICQATLDILYHFINFINSNSFIYNPEIILAKKHLKRTPLNLPPLLGYFRSPEEESSCDTQSNRNEDSLLSSSEVLCPAFPSYFHHSESSEVSVSCVNTSTPSKITFKGFFQESEGKPPNQKKETKISKIYFENSQDSKKSEKRSILSEITNENISAKDKKENCLKNYAININVSKNSIKENTIVSSNNRKQPKKAPKRAAKKIKLIQGQGKITSFFVSGKSS